jgi:hypothetical protein
MTDTIAFLFLPPLFIHFAAIYPLSYHLFSENDGRCCYVPSISGFIAEVCPFARCERICDGLEVGTCASFERVELIAFASGC